jgi:3-phenylpropionate/cinnamic acid dioxygenase small subunit
MTRESELMNLHFQVTQLVNKYNMSWDDGKFEKVSECFTKDGVFVAANGTRCEGREAIVAFGKKSLELFGSMRHLTSNHVIEKMSNDSWRHQCYMLFTMGVGTPEMSSVTAHYDDEFIVTSSGPLFTKRVVVLDAA